MRRAKNQLTLEKNLMNVYGISKSRAKSLCITIGVNGSTLYGKVASRKKGLLTQILQEHRLSEESDSIGRRLLEYRNNQKDIKKLINCWSGRRLKIGLPTRGQRTRSNGMRKNDRVKKQIKN